MLHRPTVIRIIAFVGAIHAVISMVVLNPEGSFSSPSNLDFPGILFLSLILFIVTGICTYYFTCVLVTSSWYDRVIIALTAAAIGCGAVDTYHPVSYALIGLTVVGTAIFSFLRQERKRHFPTIKLAMGGAARGQRAKRP